MLNGGLVDESDYDVSEGSTIATLHKDYLDTLQPGAYTLRFQYTDGFAEAGFVVQDHMPSTGDNDLLLLFGFMMVLSLAAILLLNRKKSLR
jgi:LPXTG-motif cell wall-anchored protein